MLSAMLLAASLAQGHAPPPPEPAPVPAEQAAATTSEPRRRTLTPGQREAMARAFAAYERMLRRPMPRNPAALSRMVAAGWRTAHGKVVR